MYHEKQSRQLCALHVLNNLFQDKNTFTQKDLDEICRQLSPDSWINPHKSIMGLGNYDVNVLMAAVQRKGYEARWFDKRRNVKNLRLKNIFGFILNIPSPYRLLSNWFGQKHWIAIRYFPDFQGYFNLDSHLSQPLFIGNEEDVLNFFEAELMANNKELILIVSNDTKDEDIWISSDNM